MKKHKVEIACTYATSPFMRGVPTYPKPKRADHLTTGPGWRQFKSYRRGMKAAKRGEPVTSCPYQIDEDTKQLLIKRDRWMRGYEEVASAKVGVKAYVRRMDRERKEAEEKRKKKRTIG